MEFFSRLKTIALVSFFVSLTRLTSTSTSSSSVFPPDNSHAETLQQTQHSRLAAPHSRRRRRRPSVTTHSSSSASFGDASQKASAAGDSSTDGLESDSDDLEGDSGFQRARWATFIAMFVGYGAFYLTRNSLAFTAPAMLEDKALGLTLKVRKKKKKRVFDFFN